MLPIDGKLVISYPYNIISNLGLDIKPDPTAGDHKVIYLSYARIYKRSFKFIDSRLKHLEKEAKKMLKEIKYPHHVIDCQVIYNPKSSTRPSTLGFKIAIRFINEED